MPNNLDNISTLLSPIIAHHGSDIALILVGGSIAYGTNTTDSDIDIWILSNSHDGYKRLKFHKDAPYFQVFDTQIFDIEEYIFFYQNFQNNALPFRYFDFLQVYKNRPSLVLYNSGVCDNLLDNIWVIVNSDFRYIDYQSYLDERLGTQCLLSLSMCNTMRLIGHLVEPLPDKARLSDIQYELEQYIAFWKQIPILPVKVQITEQFLIIGNTKMMWNTPKKQILKVIQKKLEKISYSGNTYHPKKVVHGYRAIVSAYTKQLTGKYLLPYHDSFVRDMLAVKKKQISKECIALKIIKLLSAVRISEK